MQWISLLSVFEASSSLYSLHARFESSAVESHCLRFHINLPCCVTRSAIVYSISRVSRWGNLKTLRFPSQNLAQLTDFMRRCRRDSHSALTVPINPQFFWRSANWKSATIRNKFGMCRYLICSIEFLCIFIAGIAAIVISHHIFQCIIPCQF